jgi:hypothetical protein
MLLKSMHVIAEDVTNTNNNIGGNLLSLHNVIISTKDAQTQEIVTQVDSGRQRRH